MTRAEASLLGGGGAEDGNTGEVPGGSVRPAPNQQQKAGKRCMHFKYPHCLPGQKSNRETVSPREAPGWSRGDPPNSSWLMVVMRWIVFPQNSNVMALLTSRGPPHIFH